MDGPFGAGAGAPPSGFPPPGFPPAGFPPAGLGPIVVHRARLVPRLLLVTGLMALSFAVTGAVVWFTVLGTADDVRVGARDGATRAAERQAGIDGATDQGTGGAGVAVPDGWPEALAPPAGATVVSSVASGTGTPDEQLVLVYEVRQDAPAAAEAVRTQLASAGLAVTSDAVTPGGIGSITATGAGHEASVAVSPSAARPGVTTVSWVLRRGLR